MVTGIKMANYELAFENYIKEINNAYLRGDATEHTHRPALKTLLEAISGKIRLMKEHPLTEMFDN